MEKESIDLCQVSCIHGETVKTVQSKMLDKPLINDLADTFKIMGDPTRIEIIFALSQSELCVCDLAAVLGMSQSAISHQLRLMRNLRIVKYRKDGKIVYYSIDDEHIINLFNEGFKHVSHD
jgi:ArsR family transcriptional regulator, lead/cadmium/zinc/bismuth-responsive transcriptional repressor